MASTFSWPKVVRPSKPFESFSNCSVTAFWVSATKVSTLAVASWTRRRRHVGGGGGTWRRRRQTGGGGGSRRPARGLEDQHDRALRRRRARHDGEPREQLALDLLDARPSTLDLARHHGLASRARSSTRPTASRPGSPTARDCHREARHRPRHREPPRSAPRSTSAASRPAWRSRPTGRFLVVAEWAEGRVSVIDTTTNAIVSSVGHAQPARRRHHQRRRRR